MAGCGGGKCEGVGSEPIWCLLRESILLLTGSLRNRRRVTGQKRRSQEKSQ